MLFLFVTLVLAIGVPMLVIACFSQGWIPGLPSFLFETTWLVAFVTTVIFIYLYRSGKGVYFVQLYLLSMAVKLIAYFAFTLIMIMDDRRGALPNVLYFLVLYFIFTAVEIGFLYRRINRPTRP